MTDSYQSTKVEIEYIYQTQVIGKEHDYLQKQKLNISIRHETKGQAFRNLQKQKLISIRLYYR